MERPSPTNVRGIEPETLESQLREMYGRVAYTHKTHEKMADAYEAKYRWIKRAEIVLSAISTSSILWAVFGDSRLGIVIGAVISTVLLGFVLYFKEAPLGAFAQRHSETAARLWGFREELLSLLVDLKNGLVADDVRSRRDSINSQLERLYRGAPRTDPKAYAAAQKALKEAEELYFSDDELDHLLPPALRRAPK